MRQHFLFPLICLFSVILFSCKDDIKENIIDQKDYSIQANERFDLISQHSNGWIKEGVYLENGVSTAAFEYYENGYIKTAKVYNTFPKQHLSMEISRSENNKALWSKYYTEEGELWMETNYEDGLAATKKIYSEAGTAIRSYEQGKLKSVVFSSTNNKLITTTTYDATKNSRKVNITENGETILTAEYPIQEAVGDGIYLSTEVPVANPFGNIEKNYIRLLQTSASSPSWKSKMDPLSFMFPFRLTENYYVTGSDFIKSFALSTELYQSVIEQYPVTENGVLLSGSKYIDGYENIIIPFALRDSLTELYENDSALYTLKYGQKYVEKVGYGQSYLLVGAIRNLPTNGEAADEIKALAKKHLNTLLSNNNAELTAEEKEVLNLVWFEVKFFSHLDPHRNGLVINSYEQFNAALEAVNQAELKPIQLEYQSVDYL